MAFIDDLKQGLSDVTKTVYEKSEQFVGIQKLRMKKNSLNSELKATYIEIGKMVYEEKKAGAEFSGPVVQLCQKVDLGLEAIQEVEAQIEEVKTKNEVVDDDFDVDDIFEEDVEEVAAEDITTSGLYRDPIAENDTLVSDTTNFGNLPWREVFTDPQLQSLIEAGLKQNTDLLTAAQNVKAAEASLLSARLAYAPSLGLSPQGTISSFDKNAATKTYSLPVTASWQVDLFGQLLNSKRNAQVTLKQTKAYRQAVQTQVISNIANMYYTLMMLDRQLEITKSTAEILKKNAETMEAMKDAAMYNINSTGVEQSKAAYAQVLASIPDIEQSIRETENALSTFLGEAPHAIKRGTLEAQVLPTELSAGVPIQLLSNRPDVKAAEMALASCYYNTNSARAAFYPQITLSGSAGWTNSAGSAIINPGKLLASAVGSLTQPLFYRGQNIARLKAAKAQEESAKLSFQQALLNAGSEVSNALSLYQKTSEKVESRRLQVESAKKASEDTKELFNLGTSTYLEVLSAQQSYLSAQISQVSDCFDQMQAVVSLYQALGGGREE